MRTSARFVVTTALFLQSYRSDAAIDILPISEEFVVNTIVAGRQSTASGAPAGDGRFLATWTSEPDREKQHLALRLLSCNASPQEEEFGIEASFSDGDNAAGVVAANGEGALIAWTENRIDPRVPGDIRDYSVIAQSFTLDGTPATQPTRPLDLQLGNEFMPEVTATKANDFAVVWTDYNSEPGEPENASRIRWQLVDPKQSDPSPIIDIATYSKLGLPINPDIATPLDDEIVVVWQELGKDGSGDGVRLKRFSRDGEPIGDEISANTTTFNHQQRPRVAVSPTGLRIVVWQSEGQDGDGPGIFGQLFSALGDKIGSEFQVNRYTMGAQDFPSVTAFPLGFLVSWESYGQDGDGFGGFAQAYSWAALPLGDELRLNTTSTGDQREQKLVADSKGNILALWTGQDGDRTGVFGRHFRINAPLCGDPVLGIGCRQLTAADALAILRGAVGADECPLCICDTNGSGELTASDSLNALRGAVGLSASMSCAKCDT